MQKNNINLKLMASKSVTIQIAIIEAFTSEAIKPKEEFPWPIKQR